MGASTFRPEYGKPKGTRMKIGPSRQFKSPTQRTSRSHQPSVTGKKQRLVVCLDGTWNNRDDNTNVLHHLALIVEGDVPDGNGGTIFQTPSYHLGVGTGVLDGISGGAFGFGLEQNVRDAYNWLVQTYEEGDGRGADEIYIFGFSRGAYTARSLVGFIGRCGLLRRGAPLTINQLWEQYCILGREHEERGSRLESAFGEAPAKIRQITELICDPWQVASFEAKRAAGPRPEPDAPDRLPGQRENVLNETEKLLVRWSRRVKITYLGVYDTVGAMGFDALAIPGVKSKLALHHNMRPTTLIQSCRHALAIDEHRSSFNHTPFVAYIGHETTNEQQERTEAPEIPQHFEVGTDNIFKQDWQRIRAMWRRKIEQRWFVGAHSNIGGGYASNRLAQRPFAWVLEGATNAGLVCEAMRPVPPLTDPLPRPRDSFAEFARPFWTMLFRAKPHYRPIDPEPEFRASHEKGEKGTTPPGFALESINEQVDESVFEHWAKQERPPNLAEYAKRKLGADTLAAENNPAHPWLGHRTGPYVALVLWAMFAAFGVGAMREFVMAERGLATGFVWILAAVAFGFPLVDWGESKVNFSLAAGSASACQRAFRDSIYWTRAIGVVLCVIGTVAAFNHLWPLGWNEDDFTSALSKAREVIAKWWPVPLSAGLGVLLGNIIDAAAQRKRLLAAGGALLGGPTVAMVGIVAVILVTDFVGIMLAPVFNLGLAKAEPEAELAAFAGLLLLLQFSALYFLKALSWCGEPMTRANLGSIVPLQFCVTPGSVRQCLEDWCNQLTGGQHKSCPQERAATCYMCRMVGEVLWRDIIGFIPVYSLVLGFGMWFAAKRLVWEWLNWDVSFGFFSVPLWLLLPITASLTDYLEDTCQLHFLKLHVQGRSPRTWLTPLSFAMSVIKATAFTATSLLTLAALVDASWLAAVCSDQVGWRGLVAFSISFVVSLAAIVLVLGALFYRMYRHRKSRR